MKYLWLLDRHVSRCQAIVPVRAMALNKCGEEPLCEKPIKLLRQHLLNGFESHVEEIGHQWD